MDRFKANVTGIVAILILALSYAILFSIIFWDFPNGSKRHLFYHSGWGNIHCDYGSIILFWSIKETR